MSNRSVKRRQKALELLAFAMAGAMLVVGFPRAQSQQATSGRLPAFEVPSIKPNHSGDSGDSEELLIKPGRFEATDAAVRDLIADAYGYRQPGAGLRDNQILGAPQWLDSKKYDIGAKVDRSPVDGEEKELPLMGWRDQIKLMIQSLLADRFKLKVKQEPIQRPAYTLVVAKGGPKMPKTEAPPPEPPLGTPPPPGARPGRTGLTSPGNFNLHAFTLGDFANRLSNMPEFGGRPVFDQTGLSGAYDFILHRTPSSMGPNSGRITADHPAEFARITSLLRLKRPADPLQN